MSSAVIGGIDVIGEILNQQKASSNTLGDELTIQEEGEPKPEASDVSPDAVVDVSNVDPKPQPLEPVVIISRPSLSDEEEAEKNIIVVDGNAAKREEAAAEVCKPPKRTD